MKWVVKIRKNFIKSINRSTMKSLFILLLIIVILVTTSFVLKYNKFKILFNLSTSIVPLMFRL